MSRAPQKLYNGRIENDLANWDITGAVVYDPAQGSTFLGSAFVPAGATLAQDFGVGEGRTFTLDYKAKAAVAGSITVEIGRDASTVVWSRTDTAVTRWQSYSHQIGLPYGTYWLRFSADVDMHMDDVSLAHIYKSRVELAQIIHTRLGVLATSANITDPCTALDDYNDALDAGLRGAGALYQGVPDIRLVDASTVDAVLDGIELAMLQKLHRYWSTKTDFSLGPRSESISQVTAAIDRLIGTAVGGRSSQSGRAVKTRRLIHGGY